MSFDQAAKNAQIIIQSYPRFEAINVLSERAKACYYRAMNEEGEVRQALLNEAHVYREMARLMRGGR